jgi:C-terminal processing protease CtpA/Prc
LYYSSFSNAFSQSQLKAIFKQFEGCSGLIVDVRENGGGSLSLSEALASYFMDKKTLTGYIAHKTGDGHSAFSKLEPVYTPAMDSVLRWHKPVVVLTNRHCYSATNDFVVRMKAAPSALIMGDQTGGGGGLPLSNELPNGWMLRFSACPMYDADKQHTEWGVLPDVAVSLDSTDLAGGYDTLIERAIGWLTAN